MQGMIINVPKQGTKFNENENTLKNTFTPVETEAIKKTFLQNETITIDQILKQEAKICKDCGMPTEQQIKDRFDVGIKKNMTFA